MLAFDIETMGLDQERHAITVAAICDRGRGVRRCFNFMQGGWQEQEDFLRELDEAEALCSFNGAKFDIPFIAVQMKVPRERYERWMLKLFDYYEVARLCFGSSMSLGKVLNANGMHPKISSGKQAVVWAKEGKFQSLMEYCQDDADLTHDISVMREVRMPLRGFRDVLCTRPGVTGAFEFKLLV